MTGRRAFLGLLGGVAAWPLVVRAQGEHVAHVGVLIFGAAEDPVAQSRLAGLRKGLEELHWSEGRNLMLDFRFCDSDPKLVTRYADELVKRAPDVIVTGAAPATMAVQERTQTIPIVFVEATNASGYGLTGKLAHPHDNTTGITNLYMAIGARWLEFLREAVPNMSRVALLHNPDFDNRSYMAATEVAAKAYHITAVRTPVRNSEEIAQAIEAFAREPNGGLLVLPPTPAYADVALIFRLATRYRLPAIYPTKGFAAEGGLMAYGAESADLFALASSYVDRILHGAKPSDLPVQFPTKFDLVVNLRAAREIGLEVPKTLIEQAVQVIQ